VRLGLAQVFAEEALDFAIQMSPDHPWLKAHPDWFSRRPDGTLKYAENPPKRYQDIYNVDFGSEDWRGLWQALLDVVLVVCVEGRTVVVRIRGVVAVVRAVVVAHRVVPDVVVDHSPVLADLRLLGAGGLARSAFAPAATAAAALALREVPQQLARQRDAAEVQLPHDALQTRGEIGKVVGFGHLGWHPA